MRAEEAATPEVGLSVDALQDAHSVPRALRPVGVHRVRTRPDQWIDDAGAPVIDPSVLGRLGRLAIPPAWRDVWATLDTSASVQATGVDGRGRTQYRYAPEAVALANDRKFDQMLVFAAALPALRQNVAHDLAGRHHDVRAPRTVTAAVVRLLDLGLLRVGNERYARDNHTYGLTTLRRNQVAVHGPTITFDFVGKEHLAHTVVVTDRAAAQVVRALLATEGDDESPLFSTSGEHPARLVTSAAVNAYLHSHTGAPATAKVFRTWGATVAAVAVLAGAEYPTSGHHVPKERLATGAAAALLGDTVAVTRSSYIHPAWVDAGRSPIMASAVTDAALRLRTLSVTVLFPDPAIQAAVLSELVDAPAEPATAP
jgi:DNA topoisomerase I